jgi:hypothetical protein
MSSRLPLSLTLPLAPDIPRSCHASHGERLHSSTLRPHVVEQPLAASPFACSPAPGARAALLSSPSLRYDSFQPWRRLPNQLSP